MTDKLRLAKELTRINLDEEPTLVINESVPSVTYTQITVSGTPS